MYFPPKKPPVPIKPSTQRDSVTKLQNQQKRLIAAKFVATDPLVKAGLERREQMVMKQLLREKASENK